MTLALGPSWLDPDYLLDSFGIWGLLLIVFAESGLLIGFFLPGDSLLFTAGMLITSGTLDFPLWAAVVLICIAAILGDQAGYMFGKKVGPSLFTRPDSRLFKQENVTKAHEFFEKHGPKSLVLARFVPIVRTFTPIIAGVSGMKYRTFLIFNVVGGILWGAGVTLLGSWLGSIEFVRKNIEPILLLIVFLSVLPIIFEFLKARREKKRAPAQEEVVEAPAAPVMDDATTQLRRVSPAPPQQYGDPRRQQGHRPYDDGGQYGSGGHGQDGYGQGGYEGNGHDGNGYDRNAYGGQGGHGGPGGYGQGGGQDQSGYDQGGYDQGGYGGPGQDPRYAQQYPRQQYPYGGNHPQN